MFMRAFRGPQGLAGVALLALLVLVFPQAARAGDPATDPAAFVQDLTAQTGVVLNNAALTKPDRRDALRTLFATRFDTGTLAMFALGRYSRTITEGELAEYRSLFETYVVGSYADRLSTYAGASVAVTGTRPGENGQTIVMTSVQRPGERAVPVEWTIVPAEQGLRVRDLSIEGVSLAVAQKQEFASVIRNGGVPSLLKGLRQQVARLQ